MYTVHSRVQGRPISHYKEPGVRPVSQCYVSSRRTSRVLL